MLGFAEVEVEVSVETGEHGEAHAVGGVCDDEFEEAGDDLLHDQGGGAAGFEGFAWGGEER